MNKQKAAVVMQTDFGKDMAVCTMQGVYDGRPRIKNI